MGLALVDRGTPRLSLCALAEPQLVLGAFQRATSAVRRPPHAPPLARRCSGGPTLWTGPGTLHLWLSLPRPDALVPCDPPRLLNRYVRPLLRGLTRLGAPALYGGRDWVSVARHPVAWVGFAHDEASGASVFESFIALDHPFVPPESLVAYPQRRIDPFAGRAPATLSAALGRPIEPGRALEAIAGAFRQAYGEAAIAEGELGLEQLLPPDDDRRPPFAALDEDVIGFVGARVGEGGGLGGDFFASEGVAAALDGALVGLPEGAGEDEAERAIAEALGSTTGALEGLRDPHCLARAARAAAEAGAERTTR